MFCIWLRFLRTTGSFKDFFNIETLSHIAISIELEPGVIIFMTAELIHGIEKDLSITLEIP